jgi:hypothetical protein
MIDVGPLFIWKLSFATSSSRICCINVSYSPDCSHVRWSSRRNWQTVVIWKKLGLPALCFNQICSLYVKVSTKICYHLLDFRLYIYIPWGHWATSRKVAVSISDWVIGFCIDLILLAAICPWGRLSLWQKWVPEVFPGGKGGRCVGLIALPPSCEDILEILGDSTAGSPKGLSRTVMR